MYKSRLDAVPVSIPSGVFSGYMGWFSFIRFDLLFVCLLLGFICFCFCLFVFLYLQFLFVLNSRVIFFHVLLFVFD